LANSVRFENEATIREDMVKAFSVLTSDINALHMNEEVARKTRFRTRIVHGMLPFSLLSLLNSDFPGKAIRFRTLKTRFIKPIHYEQKVLLEVDYNPSQEEKGSYDFVAHLFSLPYREKVTEIKGSFILTASTIDSLKAAGANPALLTHDVIEEKNTLETLHAGDEAEFGFLINEEKLTFFAQQVIDSLEMFRKTETVPCRNLVSILLLSTIVGMKIPGRYATFSSFKVEFQKDISISEPFSFRTHIKRVSKASEVIKTLFTIESQGEVYAEGQIESLVNMPPVKMLSCGEIREMGHNDLGIKGRVALITGSSRGIGETTAKLLSMLGCKVVITYFKGKSDAEDIVNDIVSNGGEAMLAQCDVTSEESVATLFKNISEKFGDIDILVNNAVKEFSAHEIEGLNWEDFLGELEVALKGAHLCSKIAIPGFKKKNRGKIINLSTIAVANPPSGQAKYISAKSALEGYTKSLAKDLVKFNVQANIVVPNMAETDLVSSIPSAYRSKIAQSRPYGRHIRPIEVAQSIAFLASPWSDAITGQKIVLNLGEPPFA